MCFGFLLVQASEMASERLNCEILFLARVFLVGPAIALWVGPRKFVGTGASFVAFPVEPGAYSNCVPELNDSTVLQQIRRFFTCTVVPPCTCSEQPQHQNSLPFRCKVLQNIIISP